MVTETDLEIETRFRERISGRHPEHGIIGEEYGEDRPDASVRWFIDPIDGTRDLIDGVPLYATLVAVERDGELQVGFVSLPGLGERWFAWRGGGAWNGSRSIRVSEVGALSSSRLLYYSLAEMRASPVAAGFDALVARVLSDRAPGSVWSDMLVAQGAAEAAIELDLDPWDVAASLVIVEEAGGRATDLGGVRTIHGGNFVASNGRVHDPILGILGRSGE